MISLSVLTYMHVEQLELQLMWTGFPLLLVATFLLSMKSGFDGKILLDPELPMNEHDRSWNSPKGNFGNGPWQDYFMSGIAHLGVWMAFMTFVCLVVYLLEYGSDDATGEIAKAWLILYCCVFSLTGLLLLGFERAAVKNGEIVELNVQETFWRLLFIAYCFGQLAFGGLLFLRFDMSVSLVHCLALLPGLLFSVFTFACAFWFLNGLTWSFLVKGPSLLFTDLLFPLILTPLFVFIQMITLCVYAGQDWSVEQNFVALGFLFLNLAILVAPCCYGGYIVFLKPRPEPSKYPTL